MTNNEEKIIALSKLSEIYVYKRGNLKKSKKHTMLSVVIEDGNGW